MLETLTMGFMLLGLAVFYLSMGNMNRRRMILAGVLLGSALLTKEVAFIAVIVILAYALVFERRLVRGAVGTSLVAGVVYVAYPVGAYVAGQWDRFLSFRLDALNRVLAVFVRATGGQPLPGNPGAGGVTQRDPGFLVRVQSAVGDYGPSYVLLAAGAVLTLAIIMRYRDRPAAQFIGTWSAISFAAVGLGVLDGFGDQFFYYVMVPASVVIGDAAGVAFRSPHRPTAIDVSVPGLRQGPTRWFPTYLPRGAVLPTIVVLFAVLLAADGYLWYSRFVVRSDDSYARIAEYVEANVEPGATIVVGGNAANFLLRPSYVVKFYRDPPSISRDRVKYFILSSKELAQGYNRVTPAFYDYVMAHTDPIVVFYGDTYWTLGLYAWSGAYPG
jgi:hypothetical protein